MRDNIFTKSVIIFTVILVASMVVMQPLQVAQATHFDQTGFRGDVSEKGGETALCFIPASLFYASSIGAAIKGDKYAKADVLISILSLIAGLTIPDETFLIIMTGILTLTGFILGQASTDPSKLSWFFKLPARLGFRFAENIILASCPPTIFNLSFVSGILTSEPTFSGLNKIPDKVFDVTGNENYQVNPTDTSDEYVQYCTQTIAMNLDSIHHGRGLGYGEMGGGPIAFWPPPFHLEQKALSVIDHNIEQVDYGKNIKQNKEDPIIFGPFDFVGSTTFDIGAVINFYAEILGEEKVFDSPIDVHVLNVPLTDEVIFAEGKSTILYEIHGPLPELSNDIAKFMRNAAHQNVIVKNDVDPFVVAGDPIYIELLEPTGTPTPDNLAQRAIANIVSMDDDCTGHNPFKPNEKLQISTKVLVGDFMELGDHIVEITVTDISGKSATANQIFTVQDTIPPDILPLDNVGIRVSPADYNNTDPFDGAQLFDVNYPDVGEGPILELPATFDFGSLEPVFTCTVLQDGVPINEEPNCDETDFIVGDKTTVRWISTDNSLNTAFEKQTVVIKIEGENNPPVAVPQVDFPIFVAVNGLGEGTPTEIILEGNDKDNDPLLYRITEDPQKGDIQGLLEPIFQQKFQKTGSLNFESFLFCNAGGIDGVVIPDPENRRIFTVNEAGEFFNLEHRFEAVPYVDGKPFTPNAILPQDNIGKSYDNSDCRSFGGLRLFDYERRIILQDNNSLDLSNILSTPESIDIEERVVSGDNRGYFIVDGTYIKNISLNGTLIRSIDLALNPGPSYPADLPEIIYQDVDPGMDPKSITIPKTIVDGTVKIFIHDSKGERLVRFTWSDDGTLRAHEDFDLRYLSIDPRGPALPPIGRFGDMLWDKDSPRFDGHPTHFHDKFRIFFVDDRDKNIKKVTFVDRKIASVQTVVQVGGNFEEISRITSDKNRNFYVINSEYGDNTINHYKINGDLVRQKTLASNQVPMDLAAGSNEFVYYTFFVGDGSDEGTIKKESFALPSLLNLRHWWNGQDDKIAKDLIGGNSGVYVPEDSDFVVFDSPIEGGSAYKFDTVETKAIDLGKHFNPSTASLSLSAWVKPDLLMADGRSGIITKWQNAVDSDSFGMYLEKSGGQVKLYGIIGVSGISQNGLTSSSTIPLDQWSHVAMTYDSDTDKHILYVNGQQDGIQTIANGLIGSSAKGFIGADHTGIKCVFFFVVCVVEENIPKRFFNGLITEVYVYDRDINPKEIGVLSRQGDFETSIDDEKFTRIGVDDSNNVYVLHHEGTGPTPTDIWQYDSDLSFNIVAISDATSVIDLAIDSNQNIYTTNNAVNTVKKHNYLGANSWNQSPIVDDVWNGGGVLPENPLKVHPEFRNIASIAIDQNDNVYVADTIDPKTFIHHSVEFQVAGSGVLFGFSAEIGGFLFDVDTSQASYYIDNIELRESGVPNAPNLLENSGFDDGLNDWNKNTLDVELVNEIGNPGPSVLLKGDNSDLRDPSIITDGFVGSLDFRSKYILSFDLALDEIDGTNGGHSFGIWQNRQFSNQIVVTTLEQQFEVPRVQKFSDDGTLLKVAFPDGIGTDVESFLEKGDFVAINDISVGRDFYVAEGTKVFDGQPFGKRIHVFDINPLSIDGAENIIATYLADTIADLATLPIIDSFSFDIFDLFDSSQPATVKIIIDKDTVPPTLQFKPNSESILASATMLEPSNVPSNTCVLTPLSFNYTSGISDLFRDTIIGLNNDGFPGIVQAVDKFDPDPDLTITPPNSFELGTNILKVDATDASLNSLLCDWTWILEDRTPPDLTAPAMVMEELTGPLTHIPSLGVHVVSDDINQTPTVINDAPLSLDFPFGSNTVRWIATDSDVTSLFTGPAGDGKGIFVDDSNDFYVTDDTGDGVNFCDVDESGVSIVVNCNKIFGVTGTGDGQFTNPHGIVLDNSGNRYVTDSSNNNVEIFNNTNSFSDNFGLQGSDNGFFESPQGIAIDSFERLFVADKLNYRVQAFDKNGNFLFKLGSQGSGNGEFESPTGIAIDSNGRIIVSDSVNHNVQVFDMFRTFKFNFGTQGSDPGQFESPLGIAIDSSDRIYVADSQNNKIQIFDSSGNFLYWFDTSASPTAVGVDNLDRPYVLFDNGEMSIFSALGNISVDEQIVKIKDTQPPDFTVPVIAPQMAINGFGNELVYTLPTATDPGDNISQPVQCSPESGTLLPSGTTTIFCSARDNANNSISKQFDVVFESPDTTPANGIDDLIDTTTDGPPTFNDAIVIPTSILNANGYIVTSGDQELVIFDSPFNNKGVRAITAFSDEGINDDLDCIEDGTGNHLIGFECFDKFGEIRDDVDWIVDEDPFNGFDDDGDGLTDEDPGVPDRINDAKISVCDDIAEISLDDGTIADFTCGSVTVELSSGSASVSIPTLSLKIMLSNEGSIHFDSDSNSLAVKGFANTTVLFSSGTKVNMLPGQKIIDLLGLDVVPPTVIIDSVIDGNGTSLEDGDFTQFNSVEVEFSSNEPSTFECSLNGSSFSTCTSPYSLNDMIIGKQAFEVKGFDTAGNIGNDSHVWFLAGTPAIPLTNPAIGPVSEIVEEATGPNGAFVIYPTPTVTDDDNLDTEIVCLVPSGSQFILGSNLVTCQASNSNGDTSEIDFFVTVLDTTPPTLNPPSNISITEDLDPDGLYVDLGDATSTDIVDPNPKITNDAPITFPIGSTTVTWTSMDFSGNKVTKTQIVSLGEVDADIIPPVLGPVSNIVKEATGFDGATVTFPLPTVTDNLDPTPTVECSPPSGSTFSLGQTTVTCTATDNAGNSASKDFSVIIQDHTPPNIDPHDDIIVHGDDTGVIVNYVNPSATDIADPNPVVECIPPSGSFFLFGHTTVTCTATDASGNSASTQFTIRVYPKSLVSNGMEIDGFDKEPEIPGNQFRLLFTNDPHEKGTYKQTASNPGQFRYGVFVIGTSESDVNVDIKIPYPFVTKGSQPISAYGDAIVVDGSFVPFGELEFDAIGTLTTTPPGALGITLSDYGPDPDFEDIVTVTVNGTFPETGLFLIPMHLDYGLKKTVGYTQENVTNNALNYDGTEILIENQFSYEFGVMTDPTDTQVVMNYHVFKNKPDFGRGANDSTDSSKTKDLDRIRVYAEETTEYTETLPSDSNMNDESKSNDDSTDSSKKKDLDRIRVSTEETTENTVTLPSDSSMKDESKSSDDSETNVIQINPPDTGTSSIEKPSPKTEFKSEKQVPSWIKHNARWWADNQIQDSDFILGIQYLISKGIMTIPEITLAETTGTTHEIPSWIKNNADWWEKGLITEDDFVKGIEYLVKQGIIVV